MERYEDREEDFLAEAFNLSALQAAGRIEFVDASYRTIADDTMRMTEI